MIFLVQNQSNYFYTIALTVYNYSFKYAYYYSFINIFIESLIIKHNFNMIFIKWQIYVYVIYYYLFVSIDLFNILS